MTLLTASPFRILPDYERQIPSPVLLAAAQHSQGEGVPAVLVLPFDCGPHSANRQLGKHWGQRTKEDVAPAQVAALVGYRGAGDPQLHEPVTVNVVLLRSKAMDDDNAILALKPARDLLCRPDVMGRPRLLPGDGPEWFAYGGVKQVVNAKLFPQGWTVLVVRRR